MASRDDPNLVRVREAGNKDIAAIARFFKDAWERSGPNAPGWAGASDEVIEDISSPETIRSRIGGPDRRMFLAWAGSRVVGFAATRRTSRTSVELAGIVVLADLVGRGVGTPLLGAAVQAATDEGFDRMTVRTEANNDRALGFYRSRGFEERAGVTEQVGDTQVELVELDRAL
jgi:ribosomal protein S18 acetylase RimI-like enzyme